MTEEPLAIVVDDDDGLRDAIADLLRSDGIECITFGSTQAFLRHPLDDRPGCIILDVQLPDLSGLELQEHLLAIDQQMPIIFITGYGDVPTSVRAMKAGAVDFLSKPIESEALLIAVQRAIDRDIARREVSARLDAVVAMVRSLSPREREVMDLVAQGLLNKQIAYMLGVSEITVKLHRGSMMKKMRSNSIIELIRRIEMVRDHL
ncbi:response regulator transcription factor [Rhizobium mesosinicum]|uniref:Response regulator transcription factor n=1 Tax=Rhizobium mesosinicum TaxID=335017 RepID=A0ABS7GM14_9HYPH|nr:response regulator [Rhizobium mesosinicum]MBW9051033.1 response regulator transcription factor [Rhizobium mesosinicum]